MSGELRRNAPDAIIKVDLDERAFLFPYPKQVTQLQVQAFKPDRIRIEAVFAFNETRANNELLELGLDDARDLSRRLVETVYRAQSSLVVSKENSIAINVVANGYIFQFGDMTTPRELFLSTGCIWRVCNAIARATDFISPMSAH
jgi:hypothetical protein